MLLSFIYFRIPVQEASREGKLRLLMILATIYPEKFEGEKGQNLMKVLGVLMLLDLCLILIHLI